VSKTYKKEGFRMDAQQLMTKHINVLFKQNERGDLEAMNRPPFKTPPAFYLGVTRKKTYVKYEQSLPAPLRKQLEEIVDATPNEHILRAIQAFSETSSLQKLHIGPVYEIPTIDSLIEGPIEITESNKHLIQQAFPHVYDNFDHSAPVFCVIEAGVPVSICCSAYQTDEAAEADVFTNEKYRGRGYAIDVIRAWAKKVQQHNRVTLYTASWDNFNARAIAEKLMMKRFGIDIWLS